MKVNAVRHTLTTARGKLILLRINLQLLVIVTAVERKHKPRRKQMIETKVSPTKTNTEEHVPTPSNDPLPNGEDRMQLKELMELCTNLSNKVLNLENKGRKIADIDVDAEVNLEKVYNLDMAHEETVLSVQDVDVQSERIEDVVKDVEDVVATAK
nr:hypothetical protein [Tanacetum cinerariifolium]